MCMYVCMYVYIYIYIYTCIRWCWGAAYRAAGVDSVKLVGEVSSDGFHLGFPNLKGASIRTCFILNSLHVQTVMSTDAPTPKEGPLSPP